MWLSAIGSIRAGLIEVDQFLATGLPDRRRGMTLIAQPSRQVQARVTSFLRQLQRLEPNQYYYAPSELHVTILSLFTATVEHERFFARTEEYVSAVDEALRKVAPISIELRGVTTSAGAILIQGFPRRDGLDRMRDALRRELRICGLTEGLDARYRLETAHMTVTRFRARLRDSERFAIALERARRRLFGTMNIRSFRLVKNDWYMTQLCLELIKRYRLQPTR